MFKKRKENILIKKLDELNESLTKSNILEITTLIGNRKRVINKKFYSWNF